MNGTMNDTVIGKGIARSDGGFIYNNRNGLNKVTENDVKRVNDVNCTNGSNVNRKKSYNVNIENDVNINIENILGTENKPANMYSEKSFEVGGKVRGGVGVLLE